MSNYYFIKNKQTGHVIDIQENSTKAGALLDAYPMKISGNDNQLWQVVDGSFPRTVAMVSGPQMGSNQNYIFYGNCNHLLNVSVTITITEDIVCESVGPPPAGSCPDVGAGTFGFSFQLNCYSPKGAVSAWQQYVIGFWRNGSGGFTVTYNTDNWPVSGKNIINSGSQTLCTLPTAVLPAGYMIEIGWENMPAPGGEGDNVSIINFNLRDEHGALGGTQIQTLNKLPGITTADIAPVIAFELNLVGPVNGESATLSSGAGEIVYFVDTPAITPVVAEPSCTESNYITCETANSFYGPVPNAPNDTFKQSFWISKSEPMIHEKGLPRPSTRIPQATIDTMLGIKSAV